MKKLSRIVFGAIALVGALALPAAAAPPRLPPPLPQLAVATDSRSTGKNTPADIGTFVAAGALRDASGHLAIFEDHGTFSGSEPKFVSYKDGAPKILDAVSSFDRSRGTFRFTVHVEFQDIGGTRIERNRAQTYAPALASGPFRAVIVQATGAYERMQGASAIGVFVRSNSTANIPPGLPRPSLNFLRTIVVFPVR